MSHTEILADFPQLTEDDILACLAFAADGERKMDRGVVVEEGFTALTTEGDEVVVTVGLVPLEIGGHFGGGSWRLYVPIGPRETRARTDGAPRNLR